MPRVPDGRAGWPALLGGIVAVINNYQQCIFWWLLTVFCILGGLGCGLGRENLYLGIFELIILYAPFSACERGRDGMDWLGQLWMTTF
jgi:hypothetical protein